MKFDSRAALLAGASFAVMCAVPAAAQATTSQTEAATDQAGTPTDGAAAAGGGDEIIVTANKRAENVQDIPKSVQVIGGDALRQQNIVSVGELQKLVPSIGGEGQTLALRGVGTGVSNINAPNKVGIVLDDIPQPSSSTLSNFLLDVERIEVLPGPQGTLAGRNATGGLVNMVTRGPSPTLTGFANALYTSDHQMQMAFFVAGPVSDKIQVSSSQYYDGFRGLTKNITLDKWSKSFTVGTRNKIRFLPTENFTVDLTGFYQYSKRNGDRLIAPFAAVPAEPFFFIPDIRRRPFAQQQPGVTPSTSNREFASIYNGTYITRDYGGIARFTYETPGGVTFTSINSFLDSTGDRDQDFGTGIIPAADLDARPEYDGLVHIDFKVKQYTTEFRVNSPGTGPFNYVAGLYYSHEKTRNDFMRLLFQAINFADYYTKSFAGYAHADYAITDQLKIQGGIRYESDKIGIGADNPALAAVSKTFFNGFTKVYPAVPAFSFRKTDKADFINYDVGLQYEVTPDVMFYGTYSKAQQGPVYDSSDNVAIANGTIRALPPEKVQAYEIGMKSQFFDRMLTLNVSLFNSKYQNYQVQTSTSDPITGIVNRSVQSVGSVRTRGAEVNASIRPSERLRANVNLAYVEAKILNFPNAPCYINQPLSATQCMTIIVPSPVPGGTPGQFRTQGNLAGNLLNNAPRLRLTFSADYSIPLGGDDLEFFVAPLVKYASSQRTDLLRGPTSYLDPTTYVDLNAGVRNRSITAELFVRNLFKENEQTFIPQQSYSPNGALQQVLNRINDRYVGARVRYNF